MPSELVLAALAEEEAKCVAAFRKIDEEYAVLKKKTKKLAKFKKAIKEELEDTIAKIDEDPLPKISCKKITYQEEFLYATRQKSLDDCEKALAERKKFCNDQKIQALQNFALDDNAIIQGMEIVKEEFGIWKREVFSKEKLAALNALETVLAKKAERELRRLEELAKPKKMSGLLKDAAQCPELPSFRTEEGQRLLRDAMLFFEAKGYELCFEAEHGDFVSVISLADLLFDPVLPTEKKHKKIIGAGCGATPIESFGTAVDQAYFALYEK